MARCLMLSILLLTCFMQPAFGRDAAGALESILLPHSGSPAIVLSGASMEVVLSAPQDLVLEGEDARYPLSGAWQPLPGDRVSARVVVPEDIEAGRYALAFADGSDRNRAAVYVLAEMPEVYALAHLVGPRISGQEGADNSVAESALRGALEADVALVLMSGPLTASDSAEDYGALLTWIESQPVPIFVAPGSLERQGALWRNYFGTPVKGFAFGPDGYMALGLIDAFGAGELDSDMGAIARLRRALKPLRWVVGFSGSNVLQWGMRSQLTLFADDPIDGLLVGADTLGETVIEQALPWGETALLATEPATAGAFQIIDMTHAAILARPLESPAGDATESPTEGATEP